MSGGLMRPDGDYETVEVRNAMGKTLATNVRCLHAPEHIEQVVSGGELVAHLCTDCDEQLPAYWKP